jgi:hypothetical protein
VENIRPDVRVIVTSLLGTDWMINQLRRKVNQSEPIAMSWSPDKYVGDNRNYIPFSDQGKVPKGAYMDLSDAMAFMGSDSNQLQTQGGESINYFPTHNFSIPVDKQTVIANGTVAAKDSARIPDKLDFTISGNNLFKNDLAELNIIAANKWRRPIAFTEPMALGLNSYLRSDGLAYRLTPLDPDPDRSNVNVDTMYRNLMYRFKFGGAENPDMYFDENGRRILMSLRNAFSALGQTLASRGNKDSALKVLNYGYTMLNRTTLAYGATSAYNQQDISGLQYAFAFYLAGDLVKGRQIADAVLRDCHQQVDYYNSLSETQAADFSRDLQTARQIISQAEGLEAQFAKPAASSETPKPQK